MEQILECIIVENITLGGVQQHSGCDRRFTYVSLYPDMYPTNRMEQ